MTRGSRGCPAVLIASNFLTNTFRLYPHAGHSLNKQQFTRAAKISSGGNEISENLVDVIFALFDRAGDNCLSYEEFFVVIKNRLRRQVRYM